MSLTKRYLESLPQSEQDTILGGIDNSYISPDEWVNDAENEPAEEELAEWALALMEEDEPAICDCDCHNADGGGLVCSACAANHGPQADKVDRFTERDESELRKLVGECVTLKDHNGVEWKL